MFLADISKEPSQLLNQLHFCAPNKTIHNVAEGSNPDNRISYKKMREKL